MSLADKIFVNMCKDILENGTSTEGEKVRPHWEDGTSAYTIKKFGVVNRYDLSKEFPAITLRKTAIKTCTEEMLWIWQRKSNNIHDLNSTVWDEWADEDGSIGKAYGYQLGVKHQYKEGMMDQVDRVIYDLKHNPFSRHPKLFSPYLQWLLLQEQPPQPCHGVRRFPRNLLHSGRTFRQ